MSSNRKKASRERRCCALLQKKILQRGETHKTRARSIPSLFEKRTIANAGKKRSKHFSKGEPATEKKVALLRNSNKGGKGKLYYERILHTIEKDSIKTFATGK